MKAWIASAAALMFLGVSPGLALAQSQPTGTWSFEATGEMFQGGELVSDGAYLYAVGGIQSGTITASYFTHARLRRYDPVTNSWSNLPSIASGTTTWGTMYHSAVCHDGRILVFGGYVYTGTTSGSATSWVITGYTNAIRAYTFSTGTWSTLGATLSGGQRYFSGAAVASTPIGTRIYITGGPSVALNDEFNPVTNTITPRATMPVSMIYHSLSAVPGSNRIFAMGGVVNGVGSATCYEYTPPTTESDAGQWAIRSPMLINGSLLNRYYHKSAVLNGRVYLFGGYATIGGITYISNTTTEYNPVNDTWAQRASMEYPRYLHGATQMNNKAYVYGGQGAAVLGEEYTPPNFGSKPTAPASVDQGGSRAETGMQALPDESKFDGWTNGVVTFSGVVTDPNAGQQVRLRVQVKPQQASWTSTSQIISVDSGLQSQGLVTVNCALPNGGGYDWRWRVEDAFTNAYPDAAPNIAAGWIEAFGNTNSPDFRSDSIAPTDPVGVSPSDTDILVPDPDHGEVHLQWIEATDNGPVTGISYEIQVGRNGGFGDVEAQLFSSAGTSTYPVTLSPSRFPKVWRIRARDVGGNFSPWSPALKFRVTYDDSIDHSAGDATKFCGMTAGLASSGNTLLAGVLILGLLLGSTITFKR